MRAPNLSWDHCCTPKEEGGLGIKALKIWNKALVGKYIWWLANKKDHLWVRWVNHVYMKGIHCSSYSPPLDCIWTWKKIAHTMVTFKQAYHNDQWLDTDKAYSVFDGYHWLRQKRSKVSWRHVCWNSLNVPKWSFIFWAAQLQRLLTRDRMAHMGFGQETVCFLCNSDDESHMHLFYSCQFSTRKIVDDVISKFWDRKTNVISSRDKAWILSIKG
ncbi:uncharacterized protein LOC141640949 [Silene latifolia]|uniref:uncharacterized protein LOC141640949 n=1 Tax=Silene latifolia TaxID=37657 RepID=UPI003D78882C